MLSTTLRKQQLLIVDGHQYIKNKTYEKAIYWQCRFKDCPARAASATEEITTTFRLKKEHNHECGAHEASFNKRKSCSSKKRSREDTIHEIFDSLKKELKIIDPPSVKSAFTCKHCSEILTNPITLPCGVTICQSHLPEVLENKKISGNMSIIENKCTYCSKKHNIPVNEFHVNLLLKELIEKEKTNNKFKENNPKFESCKKQISESNVILNEFENVQKAPNKYITEYFGDIIKKVESRVVSLKAIVDAISDKVITEIIAIKLECEESSELSSGIDLSMNNTELNIKKYKDELTVIMNDLDSFQKTDNEYIKISKEMDEILLRFNEDFNKYKKSLLNEKAYTFRFDDQEYKIKDSIGRLHEICDTANSRSLQSTPNGKRGGTVATIGSFLDGII